MKNPPDIAIAKPVPKIKVKVFGCKFIDTKTTGIEEEIQKFLDEENISEVVHLTQSESSYTNQNHQNCTSLTITMIYKV